MFTGLPAYPKQGVASGYLISFTDALLPAPWLPSEQGKGPCNGSACDDSASNADKLAWPHLTKLSGNAAELLLHDVDTSSGRTDAPFGWAGQCHELHIDFVTACFWASLDRLPAAGSSQPCHGQDAKSQVISLFIPYHSVPAVAGDARRPAGRTLAPGGLAAVLKSHLRATLEQADLLSPQQRIMAVEMAREMALSILQTEIHEDTDANDLAAGFYQAAKLFISRKCTDPELTPERVASAIGCSRAGLYRAFVKHGESVAAAIWTARIARANEMLTSPACANMPISEIAFRSGFNDSSTFNRLFKRTYGSAPGARRVG